MEEPPVKQAAPGSPRRPYRSAKREAAALHTRRAIRDAAETEAELAEDRDRAHATARADLLVLATELKRRGAIAADISEQDAADTMYALAADVSPYLRLSRDCGWTDARYAELIACTLQAT